MTQMIELNLPNGTRRKFFHRGSTADLGVLEQIFQNQDYSLTRLTRGSELNDLYRSLVSESKQPFILDGGANIGASACWFALEYPAAKVISFEPEPENFRFLQMNCSGLNVELCEAALGSRNGKASIRDPGIGEWGYRAEADADGNCDVLSISEIIQENIAAGSNLSTPETKCIGTPE